ncbi:sensor histidine kinase [Muriicola sp. Z0-33]|uniref:sensor histidine kinase n=1 Tax=Muriicola sp. Z0-33 TaxID=2816957 RepID=UPI002238B1F8|nr:histidine kinase [Muriicola sp. Z0-33]MCW5517324.1 histidine kinase [Muriicola sp. Z0-33]
MFKGIVQSYKKLPIPIGRIGIIGVFICLFFIAKEFTNHIINDYNFPFSWFFISTRIVLNYLLWILIAPLVYRLTRKVQSLPNSILNIVPIVIAAVLLVIAHRALATKAYDIVYFLSIGYMRDFFGANGMVALVVGSFSSLIELLVLMALFFGIDYQKRYLKNQKDLIAAQLNSLQMQLHPHFLFNTLHSISSMIDIDPKKAQKMLTKMGTLMRTMLENDLEQMVTIEKELDFIRDYLDLEQIRYADKMRIHYQVTKDMEQIKIPNMILQPLVENAIKYGIIPALDQGEIHIEIKKSMDVKSPKEYVNLKVSNSSEGNGNIRFDKGTGIGLQNIKKRLEGIYGNKFIFESCFSNPKWYVAEISLPLNPY